MTDESADVPLVVFCTGDHCEQSWHEKGYQPAERLAGEATAMRGWRLGSCEKQGHPVVKRLQERGVERGSGRRSFLKGRERRLVSYLVSVWSPVSHRGLYQGHRQSAQR